MYDKQNTNCGKIFALRWCLTLDELENEHISWCKVTMTTMYFSTTVTQFKTTVSQYTTTVAEFMATMIECTTIVTQCTATVIKYNRTLSQIYLNFH